MRLPNIDMISFGIGAAVATVVWWLIFLARPLMRQIISGAVEKNKERKLQASAGAEGIHRKIIYRQTQSMHLAASLFSLDEIAQPAYLLAPPAVSEPGKPFQRQDTVEESVPYLPGWPEIASVYQARTLTIPQALSGGMNVILVGQPGAGKSVALAHLAAQIVNQAPDVESLHESLPFLLHVADLGLPLANMQNPLELLTPISNSLVEHSSVFEAGRMPEFVTYAFQSGRALLLLDGVDELPQAAIQDVVTYLRLLLKAFPKIQVITTGGLEFANGIPNLGFAPLTLMPWTAAQQQHFLERWSELWQRHVAEEPWAKTTVTPIDSLLLNRWLGSDNFGLTPLELTLKIWAGYAGDARGPRPVNAIDAHLHRLLPANTPFEVLHVIGAQASLKGTSIFESKTAKEWTKSFEPAEAAHTETAVSETAPPEAESAAGQEIQEPAKDAKKAPKKGAAPQPASPRTGLIGKLTTNGILSAHTGNHLRFAHPIFMGFLAGKGIDTNNLETLASQPTWSGQTCTMRYVAAFGDASGLVNSLLTTDDPILQRPSLTAARLLRETPRNAPWRATIMSKLVEILQNEDMPIGLRGQVIAAFSMSGDPNIAALFRQLMMAPSSEMRRLGAIGAGVLADAKAVDALIGVINQSSGAAQKAACLALVQIGTPAALEAVATALLRGDEQLRITAAEALANHPGDGRDALREGISNPDILLRRAAIYGLARINEPWSVELIEQAQIKDEQWAVRSAAVEVIEGRQKPDPHIQRQLTPAAETPWLVEFAAKHGQGITPGVPATNVFLMAFKEENAEVRSAALNYLRYTPTEGVLGELYQKFYGDDPEMQEEIYQALSAIAYNGITLPHPKQFGLG